MARMAEFLDASNPNLEEDSPDFHKKFNLTLEKSLSDYYGKTAIKEQDLVFPIFTNYKMVSLD
jgi:hypothetical protein